MRSFLIVTFGSFIIFKVFVYVLSLESVDVDDFYTAAVVEFSPPIDSDSIEGNIDEALRNVNLLINEAAEKKVDIIVFPEHSLNYFGSTTRNNLIKYAVELKDSEIHNSTSFDNICDYTKSDGFKSSKIISAISFSARKNKIYVLINAIEKMKCQNLQQCEQTSSKSGEEDGGYLLYSSNFVFDRNGCVISRYRKFNTHEEVLLNSTLLPEVQIFHTDFDVTFGHFISYDIFSKYPAFILLQYGIQHILHSNAMPSALPFHSTLQLQQSYSFANDIALLSSSLNSHMQGRSGSGIYLGKSGPIAMLMSPENTQQLIISKIPKDLSKYSLDISDIENVVKKYTLAKLNDIQVSRNQVKNAYKLPSKKWEVVRKCNEKICCEFSLQYQRMNQDEDKKKLSYVYKLTASSLKDKTPGLVAKDSMYYCAVIACTNDKIESCGKRLYSSSDNDDIVPSFKFTDIRVKMIMEVETSEHDYLLMPTNVDFSMLPLNTKHFKFTRSSVYKVNRKHFINYTTTLTSPSDTILTFGIFGKVFHINEMSEDNMSLEYENVDLIGLLIPTLLIGLTVILFILKFMNQKNLK